MDASVGCSRGHLSFLLLALSFSFFIISSILITLTNQPRPVWAFAVASPFCVPGDVISTTTIQPNAAGLRTGTGCTLGPSSTLSLSGVDMPNAGAGAVEMQFTNGRVEAQGFIAITGPPTAVAQARPL